ncbi:hypothetical protein [Pedobacter sp. SL55]|uniref:hypothetical protein n=1 Tax=Pedobacter sp. SL55 TaxID=2995161 RepID=UPI002271FC28|nr:hypothetical protein [Pedobacter sp. SL55]WAC39497.1 hypothetical protein OVA16_12970 [Pedobacter sp. SL55]
MKIKLYILGILSCYFCNVQAQKVDSIKLRLDVFGANVAATTMSDDATPVSITTYDKVSWGDGFGVNNRAFIQALRNVVLPITLHKFNAKKDADAVNVTWSTTMEKNALHFEVLRSTDGKKFERITTVGAKGNSNELLNYSFRDTKPVNGTNYYQLKSVDRDGTFTTSIVVAVQFDLSKTEVTIIANSANQTIKVNVYSPVSKVANFSIADINGKILLNAKNVSLQKGNNALQYNLNAAPQLLIGLLSSANDKSAYKFYY